MTTSPVVIKMCILPLAILSVLWTPGETLKCYVCRPGSSSLYSLSTEVEAKHFDGLATQTPFCNDYRTSRRIHFIQECPQHTAGCLTRIQGDSLLRTCSRVSLDECKVVGDISMCYCKEGLCNAPDGQLRLPAVSETAGPAAVGFVEDNHEEGSGHTDEYFYYEDDVDYERNTESAIKVQKEIEEEIRRFREQQELDFDFEESNDQHMENKVIDDDKEQEVSRGSGLQVASILCSLLITLLILL